MTASPLNPWANVQAVRIPLAQLGALAPLRDRSAIRIYPEKNSAWVRWTGDGNELLIRLFPVPGVEFYCRRSRVWVRFGSLLPSKCVPPEGDGLPLTALLSPQRIAPEPQRPQAHSPVLLSLTQCSDYRKAAALECAVSELAPWADLATTAEIARVRGALSAERALLRSDTLPAINHATRFWGEEVFFPLGYRPEPDLPVSTWHDVLGIDTEHWIFIGHDRIVAAPCAAFEPLTRAGIRLANQSRSRNRE